MVLRVSGSRYAATDTKMRSSSGTSVQGAPEAYSPRKDRAQGGTVIFITFDRNVTRNLNKFSGLVATKVVG